ncbi:MAG: MerR family transcriptional regulator [Alistipes sp.]|nr:MerR family transcriptional regulator [Alistipes sp.]
MESKKLFYSMGEVSEMFDVKPSLLRFWESEFDVIKPKRNKKGNRLFTPADVENLKLIYHLVKERGMTLDGARKALKQNRGELSRDAELLERLQRVRSILAEVRDELKDDSEPLPAKARVASPDDAAASDETSDPENGSRTSRGVEVIEPRRKRDEEEVPNKELFAFYEQSLF